MTDKEITLLLAVLLLGIGCAIQSARAKWWKAKCYELLARTEDYNPWR